MSFDRQARPAWHGTKGREAAEQLCHVGASFPTNTFPDKSRAANGEHFAASNSNGCANLGNPDGTAVRTFLPRGLHIRALSALLVRRLWRLLIYMFYGPGSRTYYMAKRRWVRAPLHT